MAAAVVVGVVASGVVAVGNVGVGEVCQASVGRRAAGAAASCTAARSGSLQLQRRWNHAAAAAARPGGGPAWRERAVEVRCQLDASQTLGQLAFRLDRCFAEVCVENAGRPAAAALKDFVECVVCAYLAGHTCERLALQLQLGVDGSGANAEGHRLTAYERRCRSQWINAIYVTLSELRGTASCQQPAAGSDEGRERIELPPSEIADEAELAEMEWLSQLVRRTISGQATGDEQSNVKFDRSLATGGHSGGVASEKRVIAPQWVPISQLVLLTMKVIAEADAAKGFS